MKLNALFAHLVWFEQKVDGVVVVVLMFDDPFLCFTLSITFLGKNMVLCIQIAIVQAYIQINISYLVEWCHLPFFIVFIIIQATGHNHIALFRIAANRRKNKFPIKYIDLVLIRSRHTFVALMHMIAHFEWLRYRLVWKIVNALHLADDTCTDPNCMVSRYPAANRQGIDFGLWLRICAKIKQKHWFRSLAQTEIWILSFLRWLECRW